MKEVYVEQKKRISVIVNPISGGINKKILVGEIARRLKTRGYTIEMLFTQAPGHATELAKDALKCQPDKLVIVGGDGSVNEVGQVLIGSGTALAIIPTGSGNGLARHLRIPLKSEEAIDLITDGKIKAIDTVSINGRACLGIAGIGFDAEVGWAFAQAGKRGFFTYLLTALKAFVGYRCSFYDLILDGKSLSRSAFLISFANSSEFGNGASISPQARINDGFLDVVIMHPFPFYATCAIVYRLFRRSLHFSKYIETIQCKEISIAQSNLKAHIDGEPVFFQDGMHVRIIPASLNIVLPR